MCHRNIVIIVYVLPDCDLIGSDIHKIISFSINDVHPPFYCGRFFFHVVEIKLKNNKTAAVVVGRERRRSYFEKVIRPVEIGAGRERYL